MSLKRTLFCIVGTPNNRFCISFFYYTIATVGLSFALEPFVLTNLSLLITEIVLSTYIRGEPDTVSSICVSQFSTLCEILPILRLSLKNCHDK